MWIKKTIGEQRKILINLFEPIMLNLAKICVIVWSDLDSLDEVLSKHFSSIPHCHLIYAIDKFGKQISSNISANGIDMSYRNQDLSRRPYSISLYPKRNFMLSSVYISQTTGRPCVSAVQPVVDDKQFFWGCVVADFDIHHLPLSVTSQKASSFRVVPHCNQVHQVVSSRRTATLLDNYLGDIQSILIKLISEHGVFHCTLHYSGAQAMLWQMDDPYQYRLFEVEQLLDANMYQTYPRHTYPARAKVVIKEVQQVLGRFRTLRLADDRVYLRSGSLNIMNGLVGLSFSFDGSQYMSVTEFLDKDLSYWCGQASLSIDYDYHHWEEGEIPFSIPSVQSFKVPALNVKREVKSEGE